MYIPEVAMKRAITVSEARRQLPRLLREISRGGGPFYIGARGEAVAVLSSIEPHAAAPDRIGEAPAAWGPLRIEIIGDPKEIEGEIAAIRREAVRSSIESWDLAEGTPKPARPARRKAARRP
jgi:antitoxin (DNA-binding transcriptional repressor) of toxin-antitoxin stability system